MKDPPSTPDWTSIAAMPLGTLYRHRRFTGALALVGMALYVVLVPWHTVSQASLQLLQPKLVASPCHQTMARGSSTPKTDKPTTKCPICNGLAALQIATSGPASHVFLRVAESDTAVAATEDSVADAAARAPQNRGPPSPPKPQQ
jgi:hypothetical protein